MAGMRRAARELVIDAWSALSHKAPLRDDTASRINGWSPQTWIGEEHRRRLAGYLVLAAYESNVSREFLDTDDDEDRSERREYGDAGLIIDTVLAAVLGETTEVVVTGAEDEPTPGEDPGDPDPAEVADGPLRERQAFLREWADAVQLELRLIDGERNAVKCGDAVYLLGWDEEKQRPVPAVMDPGFYFPVLPDSIDSYDFPTRVHFAWEISDDYSDEAGDKKTRVRRITYDLRELSALYDEDTDTFTAPPDSREMREVDGDGFEWTRYIRDYPWGESDRTCYRTDATWILDDLRDSTNVDAFALASAEVIEADHVDLGIDFLPVVHLPNTPPGGEHYGQSSLARILQLIDDLQSADTDANAAAATTGSPIIAISGSATLDGRGDRVQVRPGAVYRLGDNGRMDAVDTSGNLSATREYVQHLIDRMLVNARIPATLAGYVGADEVRSTYAMQLSFGPLSSMIRQMRLIRGVKYRLLLKMVQRLYQANGLLPAGETPNATLEFGAYLPSDRDAVLERVQTAYAAKLISLQTAVTMLLEAGFEIDDVAEEITRIENRDFEAANQLADAIGDNDLVREFLGYDPAPTVSPAPIADPISGGSGIGVPSTADSGSPTVPAVDDDPVT